MADEITLNMATHAIEKNAKLKAAIGKVIKDINILQCPISDSKDYARGYLVCQIEILHSFEKHFEGLL